MVLVTIVTGAYKPTYNWGASHCIYIYNKYIYIIIDGKNMEKKKHVFLGTYQVPLADFQHRCQ
jgi:hypothetical protein